MIGRYTIMLTDTENELRDIKQWIHANPFESNVKYLISYSVVKISGIVESIYKGIIFDYLCIGANEETVHYLENAILESSSNPNTGNIERVLQSINSQWKEQFKKKVSQSEKKAELNSLVQLRNDFAHGRSINISIETVTNYFEASKVILNILDDVVGKENYT